MDLKLQGKLILVTGSTSGIGKAIAMELLKEGASVFINEPDADNVAKAVREFSKYGKTYPEKGW